MVLTFGDFLRLNIHLKSLQTASRRDFEIKYRSSVQGLIYEICKESDFNDISDMHDSQKPSLFTFSSLIGKFENGNIIRDSKYRIVISTPLKNLSMSLISNFKQKIISKKKINLGIVQFDLEGINTVATKVFPNDNYSSIVALKDSEGKYSVFGNGSRDVRSLNFAEYADLLISNIEKKCNNLGLSREDLKNHIEFWPNGKKPIKTIPILLQQKPYFVTSTKLLIKVKPSATENVRRSLASVFDSGIGSHTSYGFGYVHRVVNNA